MKIGDVVYLLSGSPKMTVTHVAGTHITVTWVHYNTGEMRSGTVPVQSVRYVDIEKERVRRNHNRGALDEVPVGYDYDDY